MVRSLSDCVRAVLPEQHTWKVQLLSSWDRIMGGLGTKVRLEKIEGDTLVLGVPDACWMQELYLLTPIILANINKNLDQARIKQLRFKRAGTYARPQRVAKDKLTSVERAQRTLTAHEERALDKIEDQQLREALLCFLRRCDREK